MTSLLGVVGMTGGTGNASSFNGTVPAGVTSSCTGYALVWVTNAGLRTWTVTSTGATPTVTVLDNVNASAQAIAYALLKITGVSAGDTLTFSWDISTGKAGGQMAFHDTTVTLDVVGTAATTGTSATETVPGVTSSEANEYVFTMAAGVGSASRTVSSVSGATSRATGTSGGTNRFWASCYADEVVATSGSSSGTTTVNFSGTLLAFLGYQVSLKAAGGGGSGTSRKSFVSGSPVTATRKVLVGGVWTTATRKSLVAGTWT